MRPPAAPRGPRTGPEARPGDPGYDPANSAFYKEDSATRTTRIERNTTVDYGIPGNQPCFEKLFRALFMVRNATLTPGSVDRTTPKAALGLAIEAIGEIENVDVAAAISRISAEQTQLEASYLLTTRPSRLSLVSFLR